MKLSYDPKHNIAYLRFHEKSSQVTSIKISEDMIIDIAPDGTIYGLELLNPHTQLLEDHGQLVLEVAGRRQEIALNA